MGIKRAHTIARCLLLCLGEMIPLPLETLPLQYVVAGSELPGLFGFKSMGYNRAVFDVVNLQLHFCGPADINLTLPPGTKSFQLEISPSGHLVLPCTNFENIQRNPPNPLGDTAAVLPVMESGINHHTHATNKTSIYKSTDLDL